MSQTHKGASKPGPPIAAPCPTEVANFVADYPSAPAIRHLDGEQVEAIFAGVQFHSFVGFVEVKAECDPSLRTIFGYKDYRDQATRSSLQCGTSSSHLRLCCRR